jgi:beta-phosphoglucomutase family hydrolase
MPKHPFDAVIFDLDGVITDTAKIHSAAWIEMFNRFLQVHSEKRGIPFKEFTHKEDYLPYVDGKPRYKGVQSFLDSRGIELSYGDPSDSPSFDTVCGLGNMKNDIFNELIQQGMVEVFPSTVRLIRELKDQNIKIGVASSSKNCKPILEVVDLLDLFETRVDGVVSAEMGLKGKPEPDIFTTAADHIGTPYDRTVIIEDAVSGVKAGRNGNFGLVLGVARENNGQDLFTNGADIVVKDLGEITIGDIEDWFLHGLVEDGWSIQYHDYSPETESVRETLLTVGNGYFGTRGAMEEQSTNGVNYPGTYIAGTYNRVDSEVAGRTITNEDFVNCPNWLPITFKIGDGAWVDMNEADIVDIHRQLDFRTGGFSRRVTIQDKEGRITQIDSKRVSSMANPHLAAIHYEITPINYSDFLTVKSTLNGDIINAGVERYRALKSKHLLPLSEGGEGNLTFLEIITTQSEVRIAEASKLIVLLNGQTIAPHISHTERPGVITSSFQIDVTQGSSLRVDKVVSLFTSHPWDSEEPLSDAKIILDGVSSFEDVYQPSARAWGEIWDQVDIQIEGDRLSQKLLRLHLYHSLVTASPHNEHIDAGIPARGLHGESYRGHIFWDELFILPLFNLHFPQISKSALMYRYRRLDKAREYAREFGYEGAMYPWQSGSTGREETQVIHLNPLSGEWGPDNSSLQRHVSLAIAYNIWGYYWATLDTNFLEDFGAEMFFEICRFWASAAVFDQEYGRYDIPKVMGPDEFHEKYPHTEEGGLTNNAYTNLMLMWTFGRAFDILAVLSVEAREKTFKKIKLKQDDLERWRDIQKKLTVPFSAGGIIEQFEGFFDLKELDWDEYREKYGDIHRMDRLLKKEGKSPDDYQVLKQADTLMVFYNLGLDEVQEILSGAGYDWQQDLLNKNFNYYLERTSHGSTLSRITHAYLSFLIGDKTSSWKHFHQALISDFQDVQGGTTGEGIHTGVMAGSVYNTLRNFGGLSINKHHIHLNPALPNHWRRLQFGVSFRGNRFALDITPSGGKVKFIEGEEATTIYYNEEKILVPRKEWITFPKE